jgi:hypothetical protein
MDIDTRITFGKSWEKGPNLGKRVQRLQENAIASRFEAIDPFFHNAIEFKYIRAL